MRLETLKFGSELEVKDSDIFIDYNNQVDLHSIFTSWFGFEPVPSCSMPSAADNRNDVSFLRVIFAFSLVVLACSC
ncbi:hypothetical protein ACE1CI_30495 [Aerosakkonemataceae cyanobacterium BLCC-F50]|uniref:Uncharacterized protein n=1 Tax=Floridaenema flaviceps BLCC-F50 TaxID=3153642 RepID=A0ABV4Y0N5_9CYAN